MKKNTFTIPLSKNPAIRMNVIPGHFATSHYHVSHYLELCDLKTNASLARDIACELSLPYLNNTPVDTIVCMEGMEVIGAYMAEELSQEGTSGINSGAEIHVVRPASNINKKLVFQGNMQDIISDRNILLLVSSISSGITIANALECLAYYGSRVVGISALYNAYPEALEQEVHSLFTAEDVPDYQMFNPDQCEMCKKGRKLDALVFQDCYAKMQ